MRMSHRKRFGLSSSECRDMWVNLRRTHKARLLAKVSNRRSTASLRELTPQTHVRRTRTRAPT